MTASLTPIWAALATGLVGSLHCAAMCGPLVAAGCGSGAGRTRSAAAYLAGRFVSYALVGAVMGHAGAHALCRLPVEVVSQVALWTVAAVAVWRGATLFRAPRPAAPIPLGRRRRPVSAFVASLLPRRGLGLGLATGFLPCGMLVPAWLLAASTESAPLGAAVMVAFAAASAPALIVPAALWRAVEGWLPARSRRFDAVAWWALAAFVAARPLLMAAHHHHH